MSFEGIDIASLSKLLKESDPSYREDDDSDDDDGGIVSPMKHTGPGQIGPKKKTTGDSGGSGDSNKKCEKSQIWSQVDVDKNADKVNTPLPKDPRKTPTYDMFYRQSVTTEDIFLQMGNKTPSSASCENLVVEIHLPEDDFNKIQLNLKEQAIDLRSPIHFLYLGLPHPIDTKGGTAKWDSDTEKLILTLKLSRDLDRVNF